VKGKSQAIGVYELLGTRDAPGVDAQVLGRYAEGLAAYVKGGFAAAQALFERNPDDPPSRAMARRCTEYVATPPLPPWLGVTVAHEK
jgi:adenylate cyclase